MHVALEGANYKNHKITIFEQFFSMSETETGCTGEKCETIVLTSAKPVTEIFTFKMDIEKKRLFLHPKFLDKLYTIGYLNKYITVLKEFAAFVYLAQVPALDINVLVICADLQI